MKLNFITCLAFTFLALPLTYAGPCSNALTIQSTLQKTGYGPRAFLSSEPQPTAQNLDIALKDGAMWWGNIIKVVSTLDEAKELHHKRTVGWVGEETENPLLYAMFIVNKNASEINSSLASMPNKENQQELLANILKTSDIYQKNYETQNWDTVSKDIINELKTPSINSEADGGIYFYQTGWAKPNYKGLVIFSEMSTSTSANGKKSKRINKKTLNKPKKVNNNPINRYSINPYPFLQILYYNI